MWIDEDDDHADALKSGSEIEAELARYPTREAVCIDAHEDRAAAPGWVSDEKLRDIGELLEMSAADLDGVATFYNLIFREPVGRHVIMLCDSVSCWIMGYERMREHLHATLGIQFGRNHGRRPLHSAAHRLPGRVRPGAGHDDRRRSSRRSRSRQRSTGFWRSTSRHDAGEGRSPQNIRPTEQPLDLEPTSARAAIKALRKALREHDAAGGQEEVKHSSLRGRGGAGFPTGLKWSFVPDGHGCAAAQVPGRQRRRDGAWHLQGPLLMEGNPHQLIEGMISAPTPTRRTSPTSLCAANTSLPPERLARAIAEAYAAGYLGKNILGSGLRPRNVSARQRRPLYVRRGDRRCSTRSRASAPIPRAKPPFPQVSGLWGKPTIVNNVETLCNVPHIINHGAAWFQGLSRTQGCRNQALRRQRQSEAARALGTADGHARSAKSSKSTRAACATACVSRRAARAAPPPISSWKQHLDVPWISREVQKAGSRLGTGTMIVLDDQTCPVGMLRTSFIFSLRSPAAGARPAGAA